MIFRVALLTWTMSILASASPARTDNLGILGAKPRWDVLEHYQETITRDEFVHLLNDVYCTHGYADDLFKIDNDSARILENRNAQKYFTLRFAADARSREYVPHLWRSAKSLGQFPDDKPLAGLRIALDPGHLGGEWAKMEERWFQVGHSKPVTEGDLTLKVARMLAPKLRSLGAKVFFVRSSTEPVTPMRPSDFVDLARKILIKNGVPRPRDEVLNPKDPEKEGTL
jgi:N-acetylmuramoyl-L-alanine amidase